MKVLAGQCLVDYLSPVYASRGRASDVLCSGSATVEDFNVHPVDTVNRGATVGSADGCWHVEVECGLDRIVVCRAAIGEFGECADYRIDRVGELGWNAVAPVLV